VCWSGLAQFLNSAGRYSTKHSIAIVDPGLHAMLYSTLFTKNGSNKKTKQKLN